MHTLTPLTHHSQNRTLGNRGHQLIPSVLALSVPLLTELRPQEAAGWLFPMASVQGNIQHPWSQQPSPAQCCCRASLSCTLSNKIRKRSSRKQLDSRDTFHEKSQEFGLVLVHKHSEGVSHHDTLNSSVLNFFQTYQEPKEGLKQSPTDRTAGWCEASWNVIVTHRNIPRWLLLWVRCRLWDDLPINTPMKWQAAFSSCMVLHELTNLFLAFLCFKIKLIQEQH